MSQHGCDRLDPQTMQRNPRAHPGMAYGTSGIGSSNHLTGEFLSRQFALGLTHVPYRGGNQAQTDAISGQIPLVIDQITAMVPQIASGNLRPLLLVGSDSRSPLLPEVPTVTERLLPDFRIQGYQGIFGPAGLPTPIVTALSAAIRKSVDGTAASASKSSKPPTRFAKLTARRRSARCSLAPNGI
jgi:tripartite-type tricarboxylate transporter receptor subunit TctC